MQDFFDMAFEPAFHFLARGDVLDDDDLVIAIGRAGAQALDAGFHQTGGRAGGNDDRHPIARALERSLHPVMAGDAGAEHLAIESSPRERIDEGAMLLGRAVGNERAALAEHPGNVCDLLGRLGQFEHRLVFAGLV